jgi:tyrosine aminotransferase
MSVLPSAKSMRTVNPIREVVENIVHKDPANEITLALGDPTRYGVLRTPQVFEDALVNTIREGRSNGYENSFGRLDLREAIAASSSHPDAPLTADDIVVASGCSGAIELALNALLDPEDILLVPTPGFPLYTSIAVCLGASVIEYRLDPAKNWEVDLDSLRSGLAEGGERVKGILINNPSNPCGSVFSLEHLQDIVAIAEEADIPIVSDEIYANLTFPGFDFTPIAAVSTTLPVLSVGGIAKDLVVPGWRLGWVCVHSRGEGRLEGVRTGLRNLSRMILGPCSLIQAALPSILNPSEESVREELAAFRENYIALLKENAFFVQEFVRDQCPGLEAVQPQGAMYVMLAIEMEKFPDMADDREFAQKLLDEQNIFVLPGQCFYMPNYFRIVTCCSQEIMQTAFEKIKAFCEAHYSA